MQIKQITNARPRGAGAPWPIIASHTVDLDRDQLRRIEHFSAELRDEHRALKSNWFERLGVRPGWGEGPCLYIEDHRPISRMSDAAAKRFEYRMLGLAGPNDGVLISLPRDTEFEAYMGRVTGENPPRVWGVPSDRPAKKSRLAAAALEDPETFSALVKWVRDAHGLTIVPYISSGDVWTLASALAKETSAPIHVAGPPPDLSSLANDKLWFTSMVSRLIGTRSVPITREIYSVSSLVRRVRVLAKVSERLVLKLPSSAGGLGNVSLDAAPLRQASLESIFDTLRGQLEQIGWQTGDRLLVGRWDANVRASPSVQIWVPHKEDGPPIIEGLFLQHVIGQEGAFIGAVRADLDLNVVQTLACQAKQIATLLQKLGYFGRLSLDAVLLDDTRSDVQIHWIEANARWGGVSIPMTLGHKLNIEAGGSQIAIAQHRMDTNNLMRLADIEARLTANKKQRGFTSKEISVFLVPPRTGIGLILGLAGTTQRANEVAEIAYTASLVAR